MTTKIKSAILCTVSVVLFGNMLLNDNNLISGLGLSCTPYSRQKWERSPFYTRAKAPARTTGIIRPREFGQTRGQRMESYARRAGEYLVKSGFSEKSFPLGNGLLIDAIIRLRPSQQVNTPKKPEYKQHCDYKVFTSKSNNTGRSKKSNIKFSKNDVNTIHTASNGIVDMTENIFFSNCQNSAN